MGMTRKLNALDRRKLMRARLRGESLQKIAERMRVGTTTIHRETKIAAQKLSTAVQAQDRDLALDLLARIARALDTFEEQLQVVRTVQAEERSPRAQLATVAQAVSVLGGLRGYLEILGKATGQLSSGPTVQVNVGVQTFIQQNNITESELREVLELRKYAEQTEDEAYADALETVRKFEERRK